MAFTLPPNTILDDPSEVRHIVPIGTKPGETTQALCGERWKVRTIHARGVLAATCPACQEQFSRHR